MCSATLTATPLVIAMQSERQQILTVDGAAEQLICSRWTVYGLCQSGKLRSVRVGRLLRIPQSAIDEFLEGGTDSVGSNLQGAPTLPVERRDRKSLAG
jgi:excisionase family DNA binding protein